MTRTSHQPLPEPGIENTRPAAARAGFGQTGLRVSRVGFGGMELAGPPRAPGLSRKDATRLLRAAADLGINYFDTSIDYGRSEETIGAAFTGIRDRLILATKCGCRVPEAGSEGTGDGQKHLYTAANIRAGISQSLRRLRTDYIDVMQLHGNPTMRELEEGGAIDALAELREKGVIRHIGLSSRLPYAAEFASTPAFEVFQLPYSAIQRQHEDLAAEVARNGRAVVARGVLGRGSVAKQWSVRPIGMVSGEARNVWESAHLDDLLGPMPRIEFMIRFALASDAVHVCLVGTTDPDHLAANVEAAAKGPLDPALHAEARARLAAAGSAPGVGRYRGGGPSPVAR